MSPERGTEEEPAGAGRAARGQLSSGHRGSEGAQRKGTKVLLGLPYLSSLSWAMGELGGGGVLRGTPPGGRPGCPRFGALFFNPSNKCDPFAWMTEGTCRAWLVVFQSSSFLKVLLNVVKAFSGPYLSLLLDPLKAGAMSLGP